MVDLKLKLTKHETIFYIQETLYIAETKIEDRNVLPSRNSGRSVTSEANPIDRVGRSCCCPNSHRSIWRRVLENFGGNANWTGKMQIAFSRKNSFYFSFYTGVCSGTSGMVVQCVISDYKYNMDSPTYFKLNQINLIIFFSLF